jgi:Alpha-2-macroglobulin family N-terminal region.
LQADVVDKADHAQKKNRDLVVTTRPIRIEVFPESGTLVQNVENTLYVLTAYPDGRPAKTKITIGRDRQQVETSSAGIAKVKITPDKPSLQLRVSAEDEKGVKAAVVRTLRIDRRTDAFLMRTDQALYKTGDTVKVDIISPSNKERIFVDVVKDRRAVLMKSIDIVNGKGTLALDLPADLFGTLELRGYRIQRDGNIIGDTKVIQVKRADSLVIEAKLDKETYKPAEKALLNFIVKRADGKAVPRPSVWPVWTSGFALSECARS